MGEGNRGYSTMVDALAFLVLVSVAALFLAPVLFPATSEPAPGMQEQLARAALAGLVDARVSEFNHSMVPVFVSEFIQDMGVHLDSSELTSTFVNQLFNHRLLHRTYADLLCDYAASQFYVGIAGEMGVNVLTSSYRHGLENELQDYFSSSLGPFWAWSLQVAWEPFTGVPVGGYATFGHPQPSSAWCSSIQVSMPNRAVMDTEEIREVINPFTGNITRARSVESVERQVESAFEALTDEILNTTLVPFIGPLFDWVDDFSGANSMLRLNESLLSDVEIRQSLEYGFTPDVDEGGSNSLDIDGFRGFLKTMILERNRQFLHDFSAMLAPIIESGTASGESVQDFLAMSLGERFPSSRARLSLQIWEAGTS